MHKKQALALSAFLLAMGSAHATTVPYKSLDALVGESEGIVVGTVRQVQSNYDSRQEINTFVTFDNLKVLGGSYSASGITLRLKGGRVGDEVLVVEGSPQFKEGERVLMFIQGNGREIVPLVGWTQGLFRFVSDPTTGEMMIADSLGRSVVGVEGNHVKTAGDAGRDDLGIAMRTAVDEKVKNEAKETNETKTFAGRTDDGSACEFIQVKPIPTVKPMSVDAFLGQIKQRISLRPMMTKPLNSFEMGQTIPEVNPGDAVSRQTNANVVNKELVTESVRPLLPKRIPAQAENQQ
jgi:hypothetical protein